MDIQPVLEFLLLAAASETFGGAVYDSVKSLFKKHLGTDHPTDTAALKPVVEEALQQNPNFRREAEQLHQQLAGQIQVVNTAENVKILNIIHNTGPITM